MRIRTESELQRELREECDGNALIRRLPRSEIDALVDKLYESGKDIITDRMMNIALSELGYPRAQVKSGGGIPLRVRKQWHSEQLHYVIEKTSRKHVEQERMNRELDAMSSKLGDTSELSMSDFIRKVSSTVRELE